MRNGENQAQVKSAVDDRHRDLVIERGVADPVPREPEHADHGECIQRRVDGVARRTAVVACLTDIKGGEG